jgi:hypothetical protein
MKEIRCLKLKKAKIINIDDKEFYINVDNLKRYDYALKKEPYGTMQIDYDVLYEAKDEFIYLDKNKCIKHEMSIRNLSLKCKILEIINKDDKKDVDSDLIYTNFILSHYDELKDILNEV